MTSPPRPLRIARHPAGKSEDDLDADSAELSDQELISQMLEGCRASAARLYQRLLPVVNRTLRRILGRREADHDDLVQQSFEQIVRTLVQHRFAFACSLSTWASTIAARVALHELRQRCRRRRWLVEGAPEAACAAVAAEEWEARAAELEQFDQIRRALSNLTPERAWVVYLHDVEGHRLTDIGVMLGVSVAAVQSRLVRGRKQLIRRCQQLDECHAPIQSECAEGQR